MLNTNHLSFIYSFLLSLAFLLLMHYARHSFATIAHSDCGASIAEVGACLNHAQRENRVTMIYTRKDYTRNDEIQQQVIAQVLKK